MSFFGPDDAQRRRDQSETAAPGGLPPAAADTLSGRGGPEMFTSLLSVNEFALLSDLGPHPVAQVLGASIYQVGQEFLPPEARWAGSDFHCELQAVGQAWAVARRLALDRLREEATSVGADAVVGVRLRRGVHDWARRSVDFAVSGTAISVPDAEPGEDRPVVLSDLSVQDYWKLTGSGWDSAGLLAATSVMFVSQGLRTRWRRARSVSTNQELPELSAGFIDARRAVLADLRRQARVNQADGIVGVSLAYEMTRGEALIPPADLPLSGQGGTRKTVRSGAEKRSGVVFTVHAVGTVVRRTRAPSPPVIRTMVRLGTAA